MLARQDAVADDGILVDADQASGFTYATSFVDVVENGDHCLVGQLGSEEGRALAFREPGLAGRAAEHASRIIWPVAIAHAEVADAAFAEVAALGFLAAEFREVVHGMPSVAGTGESYRDNLSSTQ